MNADIARHKHELRLLKLQIIDIEKDVKSCDHLLKKLNDKYNYYWAQIKAAESRGLLSFDDREFKIGEYWK